MNKQTFIQLIKDPSGISPEQLMELEKVVAGFPYCQAAHILIAKQAADAGSMLADQKLKKAAAYTLDRKNLKQLISGFREKELPERKTPLLKELPVIEKITEELPAEKQPVEEIIVPVIETLQTTIPEEKIQVEETVEPTLKKEEKTAVKEALTDEKRDQIIKELQENLKRLHDSKIKAAWEDIPAEIKVIGVNDVKEVTEEKIIPPDTVETNFEVREEKTETISSSDTIVLLKEEEPEIIDWLNSPEPLYPIRTEDVMVEIKETEVDTALLLEYLTFMEEKRSIFRKNKKKEDEIIDKIIKDDPTIPKLDINNLPDNSVDLASKSITIAKGPISENFAKILSLQGKRDKAIEIYEQLILKNPEKKPYFEAQIEKLKNRI